MTTADIILLAFFIPAVWQGLSKGLANQLAGIAAVFIGVWLAGRYCPEATDFVQNQMPDVQPQTAKVICYALLFFLTLLVIGLAGKVITKILHVSSLGWANRLLGLIFSIFKTALIMAVLVSLFENLNSKLEIVGKDTLSDSTVYCYLKDFGDRFFPVLKSLLYNGTT